MTRRGGEAERAVEEGQELGVIVGGGGCEDVAWGHTGDGLVVGVLVAMGLLRFRRRTSPRQGGLVHDPQDFWHVA
jgi:hypothetical protein